MNKITITFEGLCAFFTGKLSDENNPQLTVGLIDVSAWADVPEEDFHYPRITIKAARSAIIREYKNFRSEVENFYKVMEPGDISGDLSFDVHYESPGLESFSLAAGALPGDKLDATDILDIPKELYPGQSLVADPALCRARLHIRNGLLYALDTRSIPFVDSNSLSTTDPMPVKKPDVAIKAAVEIVVPDGGYAVLRFDSNTEDFVFKKGIDYEVTISNDPRETPDKDKKHPSHKHGFNHFHYYYRLLQTQPSQVLVPVPDSHSHPDGGETSGGSPLCMIGGFGGGG
jgi:hypothetical protein